MLTITNLAERQIGSPTLSKLATELRELLRANRDVKVALSIRLAKAHSLVKNGATGESWVKWCEQNVTWPSGKPYSMHAIMRWVKVGYERSPAKALAALREADNKRLKKIRVQMRKMAEAGRAAAAINDGKIVNIRDRRISDDTSEEINVLMAAWENSSSTTRRQFCHMIGVRLPAAVA